MVSEKLLLLAGALGVGFHVSVIPYEIDFIVWKLLAGYVSVLALVLYALVRDSGLILQSVINTYLLSLVFTATLATSILIHRIFLHRTRRFKGPFLAKVSKFYAVYLASLNLQHYKEIEKVQFAWRVSFSPRLTGQLHEEYGDYVRTGPREISIANPAAIPILYSAGSKCARGGFYSQATDHPNGSLNSSRDRAYHNLRRKTWDRAFSTAGTRPPPSARKTNARSNQGVRAAAGAAGRHLSGAGRRARARRRRRQHCRVGQLLRV